MRCPLCSNTQDKVIESRTLSGGDSIRRRRECLNCGYRFTSYEQIEEKQLMVIKSAGRREPFDIKKMERGIQRALEKRPVSQAEIEEIIHSLQNKAIIEGKNSHEIASAFLGELVLKTLYEIDKVAYIRFASVYRKFENVGEFISEIEHLAKEKSEGESL